MQVGLPNLINTGFVEAFDSLHPLSFYRVVNQELKKLDFVV
jgi:hypothetical protein